VIPPPIQISGLSKNWKNCREKEGWKKMHGQNPKKKKQKVDSDGSIIGKITLQAFQKHWSRNVCLETCDT
jgi:hypothetical protein